MFASVDVISGVGKDSTVVGDSDVVVSAEADEDIGSAEVIAGTAGSSAMQGELVGCGLFLVLE
nr:hypothetical protein [Desulforamulus aquiferis]